MDTPLPLEVSIQDRFIVVRYEGKEAVVIGATTSDLLEVSLPNTGLVDLRDEPEAGDRRVLHVTARYRDPLEENNVLKYQKKTVTPGTVIETTPEPVKARKVVARKTNGNAAPEVDTISEDYRDRVLNDIIASYAEMPRQDKEYTAYVTRELAEKYGVTLYQVAGVRAALTKGTYGRRGDLVRQFKRHGHV